MDGTATYDVFLSYSHADRPWVASLAAALEGRGHRVFWDSWDLHPGAAVDARIEVALHASRHVAPVLTPASMASRWVGLEIQLAFQRDPDGRDGVLLPLLRADCEIPSRIRRLKFLDFRADADFGAHLDALSHFLRAGELPRTVTDADAPQMDREVLINIWYTPKPYAFWQVMNPAVGTLVVRDDHLEYSANGQRTVIRDVTRVEHTKMRGDINNNWVRVTYRDGGAERDAWLAEARKLGIGTLLGGSERLLDAVRRFHRRNGG